MIPFLLFTQELTNWDSFKSLRMKASFPLKVSQMEVFAKGSSLKKEKEKKTALLLLHGCSDFQR